MIKYLLQTLVVLVLLILWRPAIFVQTAFTQTSFDHTHQSFDQVLKKHVKSEAFSTQVNYQALRADSKELEQYLSSISAVSRKDFDNFSQDQQLAFLINAYNAFTLKLIIDNYPVKSIKQLGSWLKTPWKKVFFTLLGKKTYLDHIEHDLIRKNFNEPRIHFAVNCASIGCPALRAEAYLADRLEQQLESATKNFLNDSSRNYYDPASKTLYLSKIFSWYAGDFNKAQGSVQSFVAPYYSKQSSPSELSQAKIKYLDYDWDLN